MRASAANNICICGHQWDTHHSKSQPNDTYHGCKACVCGKSVPVESEYQPDYYRVIKKQEYQIYHAKELLGWIIFSNSFFSALFTAMKYPSASRAIFHTEAEALKWLGVPNDMVQEMI